MKITYRHKLIIIITALSVMLTALCMILYYRYTYSIVMDSIAKNLKDDDELIRLVLDKNDIERLKRVRDRLEPYIRYSDTEIKAMQNGDVVNNIPKNVIDSIQSGEDFQIIANKLKKILIATTHFKDPNAEIDFDKQVEYFESGAAAPYIVTMSKKYAQYRIVQNLISCAYAPAKNWPGNPVGSSWYTTISDKQVNGYTPYVADQLVTDQYYTSLYSSTPLYDSNGKIAAYLEVDYPAGKELNKLRNLKIFSFVMIFLSFILSLGLSLFISNRMSSSLKKLHEAAMRIKDKDYNAKVSISNNDEFGDLGKAFNQMAQAVQKTTTDLEESNERLMSITADMHDGVGSVLTSIQIATRRDSDTDKDSIHSMACQGMGEIRFLMDAMEYESCNFELLAEGVTLLAVDILQPRNVAWEINASGDEETRIPFQMYLDVQRIIREGFANIIKHSDADRCRVGLILENSAILIEIKDNGRPLEKPRTESGGKGHKNMTYRALKYGGSFSSDRTEDGYLIKLSLKIP